MVVLRAPKCLTSRNAFSLLGATPEAHLRASWVAGPSKPAVGPTSVCGVTKIRLGTLAAWGEREMQAEVELIAARFEGDRLRYQVGRHACATGIDPDDTARAATAWRFPAVPLRRLVVHSTSWRYEHGALLLTYLAY